MIEATLLMEEDEASDPLDVGLLCAEVIVPGAPSVAHLVEELGLLMSTSVSHMEHTCSHGKRRKDMAPLEYCARVHYNKNSLDSRRAHSAVGEPVTVR
jgi:hypothetical protein